MVEGERLDQYRLMRRMYGRVGIPQGHTELPPREEHDTGDREARVRGDSEQGRHVGGKAGS